MPSMGPGTVAALRKAVTDRDAIARYWTHVEAGGLHDCWHWTGAISGRGHGRFQIADSYAESGRRTTHVVIAHRFGYALAHGVDVLLATPIVAHVCDNPLCQQPTHWRASDPRSNRREWASRRSQAGPLVDQRGARGRAQELRDAILRGDDPEAIATAGLPAVYRNQISLLPGLERAFSSSPLPSRADSASATAEEVVESDQPSLFD